MEVFLIPKFYGYCPGLKRSLTIADELGKLAKEQKKAIFFDVPLAHNEIVAKNLQDKGFIEISLDEGSDGQDNFFLVSAHGASQEKIDWLKKHHFNVKSATCPTVRRVQDIAMKDHRDGYQILLFGKADHAEVIGVNGCIGNSAIVFKSIDEAKLITLNRKSSILCQTTFPTKEFEAVVKIIKENNPDIELVVRKTICPVVELRIKNICDYANKTKPDIAVVVGSKMSSNTKLLHRKLSEVVSSVMIGDESEITTNTYKKYGKVLVVSGTSAPPEVVEAVADRLKKL